MAFRRMQLLPPHSIRQSEKIMEGRPRFEPELLQLRSKSHTSLFGSVYGGIMDFLSVSVET